MGGLAFTRVCPSGLVWSQENLTCKKVMTQVNTEVSRAQFIFPQKGPLTAVPVKIKTEKQIAAGFSLPSVSSKAIETPEFDPRNCVVDFN